MKRLALHFLEKWKTQKDPYPLLIRGARQVGKTWLVRTHGDLYSNFVEINLESHPEFVKIFKDYFGKPSELITAISLLSGQKVEKGKTLLFIDEIQESKEAIQSLRYFREKMPGLHVIGAGSLLEFAFKDLSFPVGRIDFFHLFPMNFEEYLLAQKREDLVEEIHKADFSKKLPRSVHEHLLKEITFFSMVGGMPQVLEALIATRDLNECQNVQQRLIASFREDFYKYSTKTNIECLRIVFNEIPRLWGQKFKYSHVDAHIKSRELSTALRTLQMAGLAYKVHHSSANGLPLAAQIKPKMFKVFFLDLGLGQRNLGLNLSTFFKENYSLVNKGVAKEQFIAQELISYTSVNQNPQLYYWQREQPSSSAEVDFLIEHESSILPIEVKSGKTGSLKSLHLFLKEKSDWVREALKVSEDDFSRFENITSIPFYGIMKLFKMGNR